MGKKIGKNVCKALQYIVLLGSLYFLAAVPCEAANLTRNSETAFQYGVHEVMLTGDGGVSNPYSTICKVTFKRNGSEYKTVLAFYDGENTWRARCYINKPGSWTWSSSSDDSGLNNNSGSFSAKSSSLRGKLKAHPQNNKALMTDNGETFVNINDTAYCLFRDGDSEVARYWKDYIADDAAHGITSVRSGAFGGASWDEGSTFVGKVGDNYPWDGSDTSRMSLSKFQTTDSRLIWMLDNYPDMYVQLILFGLADYGDNSANGERWFAISENDRNRTMDYIIARWAAFPQVFWLTVNDMHFDSSPGGKDNAAFNKDIGDYFAANDPWQNLFSAGPRRGIGFPQKNESWATYIHLEDRWDIAAEKCDSFSSTPKHIFLGEDYYEQDTANAPAHMDYFQRRLYMAWLFSGGSANYGGRYPYIHPYDRTGSIDARIKGVTHTKALVGLDHVHHIKNLFADLDIDLAEYEADDKVADQANAPSPEGNSGPSRPQCMRKPDGTGYIVYCPNAADGESQSDETSRKNCSLNTSKTVRLTIDLGEQSGSFQVSWYNMLTGQVSQGSAVPGGAAQTLTAPWSGVDVVLSVQAQTGDSPPAVDADDELSPPRNIRIAAADSPPAVDAGNDSTVILPENSVTLYGTMSEDNAISTVAWTQEEGPNDATMSPSYDAEDTTLEVSELIEGKYVFRLTVTDDDSQVSYDEVTVTVLPEGSEK